MTSWRSVRSLFVVVGWALVVILLPSSAWAADETGTPTPTVTASSTSTDPASDPSSSPFSSEPSSPASVTSEPLPATSSSMASVCGTSPDTPCYVAPSADWSAPLVLVSGALLLCGFALVVMKMGG